MATYYYAAFVPDSSGYAILVPDLPEVASQGSDMAECMEMAADAVRNALEEYARARKDLPEPSDLAQTRRKVAAELAELGKTMPEETIFQLIPAPSVDLTPVKISISVPRAMLHNIDAKAHAHGMTRSGFLVAAAQAYM